MTFCVFNFDLDHKLRNHVNVIVDIRKKIWIVCILTHQTFNLKVCSFTVWLFLLYFGTFYKADTSIVSCLSKIFGRNQDFPKASVWGEVTFQSAWGESVLGRNLNFMISDGVGVWFSTIYNVRRHFRHMNLEIFSNHGGVRLEFQFTYPFSSYFKAIGGYGVIFASKAYLKVLNPVEWTLFTELSYLALSQKYLRSKLQHSWLYIGK